ncbi:MAG: Gfo/Idh/MocA family oxidoreductase [Anaerolineaceae bacterium]|nr:Gfo/Idh/MocA family oxidoreductase [Anaerolineaceae bacterium]
MTEITPVNIVQIGYGYWGTNVARNIMQSRKTNMVALADAAQTRLVAAQNVYGSAIPDYTANYEKYLDDPNVEAFALVIQTDPSFEIAKKILKAGKHLFIEKPMASDAAKAEELTRLAHENHVVLHTDHIMIFHPIIRYIKKMYDEGALGDLIYFDISRMNLGPIRRDVNAMLDLAVHDLAIIDFISGGEEPYHVEAIGEKHYGTQETLTYLTLKYDGFLAHIKSSWISPIKERRTMIGGTKKMVIFDDMKTMDKLTIFDQGIIETGEEYGAYEFKARSGDITIPYIPQEDALRNSIEHFAACIREGRESLANGEQGVKVIRILDRAKEKLAASDKNNKTR